MSFSDAGTIITWALLVGTTVYRGGRWTASVDHLKVSLDELKTAFKSHAEDDERRFEELQSTLNRLLLTRESR